MRPSGRTEPFSNDWDDLAGERQSDWNDRYFR
jgi:hypothetical protein